MTGVQTCALPIYGKPDIGRHLRAHVGDLETDGLTVAAGGDGHPPFAEAALVGDGGLEREQRFVERQLVLFRALGELPEHSAFDFSLNLRHEYSFAAQGEQFISGKRTEGDNDGQKGTNAKRKLKKAEIGNGF